MEVVEEVGQGDSLSGHTSDTSSKPSLTNEDVASFLLDRSLPLTALEFYQELLEEGCELEILHNYFEKQVPLRREPSFDSFSDSTSSHSDSHQTSNQFAKLMREKEERIALLEYELRLSREDVEESRKAIKQLLTRENQEGQNHTGALASKEEAHDRGKEAQQLAGEKAMSPLEKRALNWMIKHYLTKGYKLSAITFSGEVADQNLESWDGVNTEPPSLLALYRFFYCSKDKKKEESILNQLKEEKEDNARLQKRLELAERKLASLEKQKGGLEDTVKELKQQNTMLEERIVSYYKSKKERDERERKETEERERKEKEERERKEYAERQRKEKEDRERKEAEDKEKSKANGEELTSDTTESSNATQDGTQESGPVPTAVAETTEKEEPKSDSSNEEARTTEFDLEASIEEEEEEERIDHISQKRRARVERILSSAKGTSPMDNSRVAKEVERIAAMDDSIENTIKVVADCLPFIMPGVLLNTRAELIPIILCVIKLHPEASVREKLTQMLFNLIKIPDENQRRIIMLACTALSKIIGLNRTCNELLPQCWEQLSNKHEERRVLVAEACGSLSSNVQPDLRPSLILSIITQLFDDQSVMVREATVRNLALLISHFRTEEMIKYNQAEELLFRLLWDKEEKIVAHTQQILLPVFCDWVDAEGALSNKLCTSLLRQLLTFAKKTRIRQKETTDLANLFSAFECVLVRFHESLLLSSLSHIYKLQRRQAETLALEGGEGAKSNEEGSGEKEEKSGDNGSSSNGDHNKDNDSSSSDNGDSAFEGKAVPICLFDKKKDPDELVNALVSPAEREILDTKFNEFLQAHKDNLFEQSDNDIKWAQLEWLISVFLPQVIDILLAGKENKSQELWAGVNLGMTRLVYLLCESMGPVFVEVIAYPYFLKQIQEGKKAALLQVYLVGVLPFLGPDKLFESLKGLVVNIALTEDGWENSHLTVLNDCLPLLSKQESLRVGLLTLVWELVVHPSPQVRVVLVKIFDKLATFLKPTEVSSRVLPALITMGNDVDNRVRLASVHPIGNIAVSASDPLVLEKVNAQFHTFLEDEGEGIHLEFVNTITAITPHIKSNVRDAVLLPKLLLLGKKNNSCDNDTRRVAIAKALFEAYRAFSTCSVSQEVIKESLIPGLDMLMKDGEVMGDPSYRKMISATVSDLQSQLKNQQKGKTVREREVRMEERRERRSQDGREPVASKETTAPTTKEVPASGGGGSLASIIPIITTDAPKDSSPTTTSGESGRGVVGEGGENGGGDSESNGGEGVGTPSTTMRAAGEKLLDKWRTFSFKKDGWTTLTGSSPEKGNTNPTTLAPPKDGTVNK